MKKFTLALAAILFASSVSAQTIGNQFDIAITSGAGSAPVQLSSTGTDPALLLFPTIGSSTDIRWVVTPTSTLSTNTSPPMPPGGICYQPGSSNKFISAYGVSGNTTLHVIQSKSCAQAIGFAGGGGGGGGGGGNVTIVSPVDGSGYVEVNCKVGCSGSGSGGPLGVQPISNSQAVNPATSSIWSLTGAPNVTTVSGTPITVPDTNQICSSTGWGNQTACVGTPTAGSAYQVAVTSAGYLWVQAVTTGGTPTVNFAIRISNDGGTTWFNRGIFALTNISPFQINNIANINFAGWLTGGVTNVEVIATTYTGAGSTTVTITQGQATPFVTSSATSSALNGTGATAATNVQGNGTSALPINTNLQQQSNTALAAPTAVGTPPTGNVPAIQGAGTTAVPVIVDTPASGNLFSAVTGPIPAQTSHGVNIGSVEGAGTAGTPDTHVITVQGITSGTPQPVQGVSGGVPMPVAPTEYPATAVPITASATGTTAATTATLTNVSGHTTYICGYSVRANATAATTVLDTVTGVITATMSSELWVAPNTSGLGVDEQIFSPCIPASAVSTSIAVVSGAPGTGGLVSVKAWGFSL